jgi:hypothetical protein
MPWATVRAWLDVPRVRIVTPGDRHAQILFGLLDRLGRNQREYYRAATVRERFPQSC